MGPGGLGERVQAVVDHQLPPQMLVADADTLRRARLVVMFSWALVAFAPIFVLSDLRHGRYQNALVILSAVPIGICAPWFFRRVPSLAVMGHYIAGVFGAVLMARTFMTGGITAFAPFWMSSLPVMAALLAGRKHAVVWLGVDVVFFVGLKVLTDGGYAWPDPWTVQERQKELVIASSLLAVLMLTLSSLFEAAKERMRLELAQRETEIRQMLDIMGQGFITCGIDGSIKGPWSQAFSTWFGTPERGSALADVLLRHDPRAAAWLGLAFDALMSDMLPLDVVLDQFPARLQSGRTHFSLHVKLLQSPDSKPLAVILVFTDITASLENEATAREQREVLAVMEKAMNDRAGLQMFVHEGDRLVADIVADGGMRDVHTLKGNAGLFGASTVAVVCHDVESATLEAGLGAAPIEARVRVEQAWLSFRERIAVLANTREDIVEVSVEKLRRLQAALRDGVSLLDLASSVEQLLWEPVSVPLQRLGRQARALAVRLGREDPEIVVDDDDIRLPGAHWAPVWSIMSHLVRNAVDHGIELGEERAARGVSPRARLRFEVRQQPEQLTITVEDDGRGISWSAVRVRAVALGLPADTRDELIAALLSDGFSTASTVSDISGRGVGLGAVAAMCRAYGGSLTIASEPGRGARFTMAFELNATSAATINAAA
jgi:two-component system chemotaxis sensor kinase CheA